MLFRSDSWRPSQSDTQDSDHSSGDPSYQPSSTPPSDSASSTRGPSPAPLTLTRPGTQRAPTTPTERVLSHQSLERLPRLSSSSPQSRLPLQLPLPRLHLHLHPSRLTTTTSTVNDLQYPKAGKTTSTPRFENHYQRQATSHLSSQPSSPEVPEAEALFLLLY